MSRPFERTVAVLCYLGALRVPLVALVLPEWAFTLPSGLLIAAAAYLYGRKRSAFLCHHGREGLKWALQSNLLLVGLALLTKLCYYAWFYSGLIAANSIWHFGATGFRWAGILVSILTGFIMYKAARGQTTDALTVSSRL